MGLEFMQNRDRTLTVVAKQGATWRFILQVVNPDQTPADLTGYSARGQIRPSYKNQTITASFTCTIQNNEVTCYIPASTTSTIPAYKQSVSLRNLPKWDATVEVTGCYVFDIELYQSVDDVERITEGVIFVDPEVTKE